MLKTWQYVCIVILSEIHRNIKYKNYFQNLMNSLLFGNFETLGKMVGEICFKLLSSRVSDM